MTWVQEEIVHLLSTFRGIKYVWIENEHCKFLALCERTWVAQGMVRREGPSYLEGLEWEECSS